MSRKLKTVFYFLMLTLAWVAIQAHTPALIFLHNQVNAQSALLVDSASGKVLFSRNPSEPLAPASTTKLLTALLVFERTQLKGDVIIDASDTNVVPASIPLRAGETVSVKTLMQSLLIGSDNDSALALARYTAGSVETFVAMMNERAAELGCEKSVFKTPNGLPASGQVTTARDLLKIFEAAMAVPELRELCQTPKFALNTAVGRQMMSNRNKLLGVYPGMGPAKTGFTRGAQHTYAASATRGGHELHLILLHSEDGWADAAAIFDFGFAQFQ